MRKENLFYFVVILSIILIRLYVFFIPELDIKVFNVMIHHFWLGIMFIVIAFFIPKGKETIRLIFYGFGIGWVIDQFIFIILGAGMDKQYWAFPSVTGAIILALLAYSFRNKLVKLIVR